jgi:roadblock/LC7 domain-containing protein
MLGSSAITYVLLLKQSPQSFLPVLNTTEYEATYAQLNRLSDTLSKSLKAEDRLPLIYLILSSHEKISSALSFDSDGKLLALQVKMDKHISNIIENLSTREAQEISELQASYKKMTELGLQLVKEKRENSLGSAPISHLLFIFIIFALMIGALIFSWSTYFCLKRKLSALSPEASGNIFESIQTEVTKAKEEVLVVEERIVFIERQKVNVQKTLTLEKEELSNALKTSKENHDELSTKLSHLEEELHVQIVLAQSKD